MDKICKKMSFSQRKSIIKFLHIAIVTQILLNYTKPKVVFGFGESGLHPLIRQCQELDLLNFKNLVNLHALKNPKTTFGLV
jgi:hypothetical protein